MSGKVARRLLLLLLLSLVLALTLVFALCDLAAASPVARIEQADTRFLYSGTWTPVSSGYYSGGSYRYSGSTSASVTVAFTGTSLDWIAKKSASMGTALVSLDGADATTVNLYSATTKYQQNVYPTGDLPYGLHTVKITRSTGNVNVDAFAIGGTVEQVSRAEQTASQLVYSGTWDTFYKTGPSGGSYGRTSSNSASVTIPFNGQKIELYATKGTTMGRADIAVDGVVVTSPNLANDVVQYRQKIFSRVLSPGVHTVTISRNPDSFAGKYINLDYVEVVGTLLGKTRYQEDDTHLLYYPTWDHLYSSLASGHYYGRRGTTHANVRIFFSGTRLDWIAMVGPTMGQTEVYLDGESVGIIDLHNATSQSKKVWSTGFLPPGTHSVDLNWWSGYTTLDAMDIWGSIVQALPYG